MHLHLTQGFLGISIGSSVFVQLIRVFNTQRYTYVTTSVSIARIECYAALLAVLAMRDKM